MRTSLKAMLLVAVSALVAVQLAQPVSAGLVDRANMDNDEFPALYDVVRRGENTAIPTSTSSMPAPSATGRPGAGCSVNGDCKTHSCINGQCVPKTGKGTLGTFCNQSTQCTKNAYCGRNECKTIKPNGSPCYKNNGCQSNLCLNSRCIAPRSLSPGKYCTVTAQCARSGSCENSKCVVPNGSVCDGSDGNCQTGYCNKISKVCEQKRGYYARCNRNAMCASNRCSDSKCQ